MESTVTKAEGQGRAPILRAEYIDEQVMMMQPRRPIRAPRKVRSLFMIMMIVVFLALGYKRAGNPFALELFFTAMKSSTSARIKLLAIYLAGFVASAFAYRCMDGSVHALLACDLVYTLIIFAFSVLLDNSSIYDPYWSLVPMLSLAAFQIKTAQQAIFAIALLYWGSRLTLNCLSATKSLKDEDWRYRGFRARYPRQYWLISFLAIHLFPTLIVFANMKNAFFFLSAPGSKALPFALGAALMSLGATLSLVADLQMRAFRRTSTPRALCHQGLWALSRHPNYMGEICFWWGVWLCSAGAGSGLVYVIPPLMMTALFLFYSIPAMERRQLEKNPEYERIQESTSSLLLLPPRRA